MGSRLELHEVLKAQGTEFVYFQPPSTIQMTYPCIVYKRNFVDIKFADDAPYANRKQYMVTIIDKNPDSPIPDNVAKLPSCRFNRSYTADNLNHDIYYIYF